MAAKDQDFEMYVGDHKNLIFTVEDVGNLEGSTIKWFLSSDSMEEILVEKSTPEITIEGNTFTVKLLPEDTENLEPRKMYYHEAEVTDLFGNTSTVAVGEMKLYPAF